MSDIPSQEEIDKMLAVISSGAVSPESVIHPNVVRKIKIYDFKRPDKFSKDQIRTVAFMHETFARQATTALSGMLRCLAHVHVASVDQLTYEEFIRSIPNPTTIAIVNMDPLKGSAILEIDPAITFAVIDRLFGGQGDGLGSNHELTEIEHGVMEGVVVRLLGNLRQAWTQVIDLRPTLGQIETNPQFAQIVPPHEMIVLVSIEGNVGNAKGMINLALPYITIEPIVPKLSAQFFYSAIKKGSAAGASAATLGLDIDAQIYMEGAKLSLFDLGTLKKGSLVKLPSQGEGRAFLRMGGRTLLGLKARRMGRRRPLEYSVIGKSAAGIIPFLAPADMASVRTDMQVLEDGMRAALRELGTNLGSSLAGMKNALGDLRQKQDEMADQLALGAQDQQAPEVKSAGGRARPFEFVRRADPGQLVNLIQQEHPQTIALILSYLDPQLSASILGSFPEEIQPEVARRIARMDRTNPEVLREVERVLEKQLSVLSSEEYTAAGGPLGLVEILNMASRSTEKLVVESLEKMDNDLAEEIKRRMFVFEDIVVLDRASASAVLKKVDPETLLRALKAVPANVKSFVWESTPHDEAAKLKKRLEEMGPVRLHEVERAQQKIVDMIREMEEAGEIEVMRPEDSKLVESDRK